MRHWRHLVIPAAFVLAVGARAAVGATFNVTNTNDTGVGSLRQAILDANATPNASSITPDFIHFAIPGIGVQTIAPLTPLPAITQPVVIDGYTQPGAEPNTRAVGNDAILWIEINGQLIKTGSVSGIDIQASDCTIRGLIVNRFTGFEANGIKIGRPFDPTIRNRVVGCFIGTDAAGSAAGLGNVRGIAMTSSLARENFIGGSAPADRNLISGNAAGVYAGGSYSQKNTIQGNYIGTDRNGTAALPNGTGIDLDRAVLTQIGGREAGAGNVIVGGVGPAIDDRTGEGGGSAKIEGNFIGADATGMTALGSSGIWLRSHSTVVGGATPEARNIISTAGRSAIEIQRGRYNQVSGNYIGLNVTGTAPLGSGNVAVRITEGLQNLIGGFSPEFRNVIVASSGGVQVEAAAFSSWVQNNYIGTDAAGTAVLPEGGSKGVGVQNNGGHGAEVTENVIAGWDVGVKSLGRPSGGAVFARGNFIGTDASGMKALPNKTGVLMTNSSGVRSSGGVLDGNVISGNGTGVSIIGHDRAVLGGNFIGLAADHAAPLPNAGNGIEIVDGSNHLVATYDEDANVIAYNGRDGIAIAGASSGNRVLGNSIYSNGSALGDLGIDLGADGLTPNDRGDADGGPNALQNHPKLTAVSFSDGEVTVSGTLHSSATTNFEIEVFATSGAGSVRVSEGQTFLGSRDVTTDENGNATFNVTLPVPHGAQKISATVTDENGGTSEYGGLADPLLNISTRGRVLTGDDLLIGGFIVTGTAPKRVLLRAIGPSLGAAGVADALRNPVLELYRGETLIAANDNWRTEEATTNGTGVAPAHDAEAALLRDLAPGTYTAVVRGAGDAVGVGLVEAYDLEVAAPSSLANVSTRGFVGTGTDVLIGGVIVGGRSGRGAQVIARAIGPSLSASGVKGALQDPMLELIDGNGEVVIANDDWKQTQQDDLQRSGIPPTHDREAAVIAALPAGLYTAVVRGKQETTGVALIELYNVQ